MCSLHRKFDLLDIIINYKHLDILYAEVDPAVEIGRERRRIRFESEEKIRKQKEAEEAARATSIKGSEMFAHLKIGRVNKPNLS